MERVGKEEEITEVAVRRNTTTASETPGAKAPSLMALSGTTEVVPFPTLVGTENRRPTTDD